MGVSFWFFEGVWSLSKKEGIGERVKSSSLILILKSVTEKFKKCDLILVLIEEEKAPHENKKYPLDLKKCARNNKKSHLNQKDATKTPHQLKHQTFIFVVAPL